MSVQCVRQLCQSAIVLLLSAYPISGVHHTLRVDQTAKLLVCQSALSVCLSGWLWLWLWLRLRLWLAPVWLAGWLAGSVAHA